MLSAAVPEKKNGVFTRISGCSNGMPHAELPPQDRQTLTAPVKTGDVVIRNVTEPDSDVIVTRNIEKA